MKYTIFVFCLISLFSCANVNKSDEENQNAHLLQLDLDKSVVKDTLHVSSFIASAIPIILETNDENMIGFISAMQVTDSCICILDGGPGGSGSLFVFNKRGQYLREIGRKGEGPGEYISIRDFTINEKGDLIFLVDDDSEKIAVYQFSTGKFLRDINFADEKVGYRSVQYNNNRLFTDLTYYSKTEEGPMLYVLDEETGNIESSCLDIGIHNHGWLKPFSKGESNFYCKNSGKPKYTHYFMDTVMTVNGNSLEPYLVIKSKDWVKEHDVRVNKNTTSNAEEDVYFKIQELPISFLLQNYVEAERYIYFVYNKQQKFLTVIYDKKNDLVLHTERLIDDIVFDGGSMSTPLIGCGDEKGMYGYINTAAVPSFYEYILNDSLSTIRPEFRDYFKNKVTSESNPVIFYYKYRD